MRTQDTQRTLKRKHTRHTQCAHRTRRGRLKGNTQDTHRTQRKTQGTCTNKQDTQDKYRVHVGTYGYMCRTVDRHSTCGTFSEHAKKVYTAQEGHMHETCREHSTQTAKLHT